jgi:hypothetical protein
LQYVSLFLPQIKELAPSREEKNGTRDRPAGGFDNELKGRKGSEQDMEDTRQNRDMVKVIREKQAIKL